MFAVLESNALDRFDRAVASHVRPVLSEGAMKPQKFILCFERTNARQGLVWSIKIRGKWTHASYVQLIGGFVETVWKGSKGAQPRAYLQGKGTIERDPDTGAVFIQVER